MDDPYSFPVQGESTLSYLEKTASSIDESKSAFKTSLSNITKPTADMLGYGSQSLYGGATLNTSEPAPIAKPKPKPRSRNRKTAIKSEPIAKVESTPSPMASHAIKQPNKFGLSDRDEMGDMRVRSTPTPWRVDDLNAPNGPVHGTQQLTPQQPQHQQSHASLSHHHSTSAPSAAAATALGGTQPHPTERNITIPHTDVNTTYNHTTNQTYQYAGYPSYLPGNKPESSMYSAQGTVHHPHTRAESLSSSTSTASSLNSSNVPNLYTSQTTASIYNQTVSN